jgi:hypothetical protein
MLHDLVLGYVPDGLRLLCLQPDPAPSALLPCLKLSTLFLLLGADCLRGLLALLGQRCRPLMQLVVVVNLEGPEASQRVALVILVELVGFLLAPLGRMRQNLS